MLRMKILAGCALAMAAMMPACANAAVVVADSSFETPQTGNYTYNPTATGVTFAGSSGVLTNGSAFGYSSAVDGSQVAFLQAGGSNNGSITQSVTGLVIGQVYTLSFYSAQRTDQNYLHEMIDVSFGNSLLGSLTAASTAFTHTSFTFTAAATSGNIVYSATAGQNNLANREYDIALDNVSVTAVPEPATWAMMLMGFGAIGFALRRQRKDAVSFG